jgi:ABC-type nitrate/sulfonate/bicarbonate transport system ATPase subunit
MLKECAYMTDRIVMLLEKDLGQLTQELVMDLKVSRALLVKCLKALDLLKFALKELEKGDEKWLK